MLQKCDHRLESFHVHVANLTKHQTSRICASYLIQQYELVIPGMNECGANRFEYVMGSSLDEVQAFRHHPCPLVGTCHHDSVPSDQKSYKHLRSLRLEYKRVHNHQLLLYQRCIFQQHDE